MKVKIKGDGILSSLLGIQSGFYIMLCVKSEDVSILGSKKRSSNDRNTLYILEDQAIYVSGDGEVAYNVIQEYQNSKVRNIETLISIAQNHSKDAMLTFNLYESNDHETTVQYIETGSNINQKSERMTVENNYFQTFAILENNIGNDSALDDLRELIESGERDVWNLFSGTLTGLIDENTKFSLFSVSKNGVQFLGEKELYA